MQEFGNIAHRKNRTEIPTTKARKITQNAASHRFFISCKPFRQGLSAKAFPGLLKIAEYQFLVYICASSFEKLVLLEFTHSIIPRREAESAVNREIGTQGSSFWYSRFEKMVLCPCLKRTQASHLKAFFQSGRYCRYMYDLPNQNDSAEGIFP